MDHLAGKTIVITGASRGIGAACGKFLASHGANVVLAARSGQAVQNFAAEIGAKALGIACDVADYAQVEAMIAQATERFGQIDGLVNNAGIIEPVARIENSDPAAWGQVVDINLKGVYYCIRAVSPGMLAAGQGTIINISSGAATGALEGWSHYCATKAAVLSLTRCGHKEFGDKGLRVMGLSPGTVATEMQLQIKASGINPVSQLDPFVHIPAEWVAQAIGYLFGPGGDAYLGGDFSLKTNEGRAAVGLPGITA
ncbi:MAG: SDR family oxidoreductase [Mangrovicoccus sp.]